MSLILPNSARISPCTLKGFEEIARRLREGEPISVTSVAHDGSMETTVLWKPDDPLRDRAD